MNSREADGPDITVCLGILPKNYEYDLIFKIFALYNNLPIFPQTLIKLLF